MANLKSDMVVDEPVSKPGKRKSVSSGSSSDLVIDNSASNDNNATADSGTPTGRRKLVSRPKPKKDDSAQKTTPPPSPSTPKNSAASSSPSTPQKSALKNSATNVSLPPPPPAPASPAPADSGSPPAPEKKKRKVDPTQSNKTLDTQSNLQTPGFSANRAPSMGIYLRLSDEEKKRWDSSIQKPKGVPLPVWESVAVDDRIAWILYHRLAIRDRKLTYEQYPFSHFKRTLEQQEAKLLSEQLAMELALKQKQDDMLRKLNAKARNVDKQLGAAVDGASGRIALLQTLKADNAKANAEQSEEDDEDTQLNN